MLPATTPFAGPGTGPPGRYVRHRPETTLLYRLVAQHWPALREELDAADRPLPAFVGKEFDAFLTCGILAHGALRVRCDACQRERLVAFSCKRRGFCPSCGGRRMAETAALLTDRVLPAVPLRQWVLSLPFPLRLLLAVNPAALTGVLGLTWRAIAGDLCRRAGLRQRTARAGGITLVQRFGSALNLNIHFHLLVADGVWQQTPLGLQFRRVPPPTRVQLERLLATLTRRIARHLVRRGWLREDAEGAQLSGDDLGDEGLGTLRAHSITYRISVGPNAGRKALTLRTLPGRGADEPPAGLLARADGFSLHAGVTVGATDTAKRERLCQYLARPPVAHDRLSLTRDGRVAYALKTPYRDGTTHVILEPQDFVARLAALVPGPRSHLTRYHGVFAPHARWRSAIVPGRPAPRPTADQTPAERHRAMTWAQRLARVFRIDVTRCEYCGGPVRIIASLTDPAVLDRILDARNGAELHGPARGPPQGELALG